VADTGLLANTGDPGNTNDAAGGVLVQTGETVKDLADSSGGTATSVDNSLPGNTGLVAATVDTAHAEGQALVDTGNGNGYLVDGATASTNDLVSAEANDSDVIGKGRNSQIGVSALSDGQNRGQLLTAGVGSGGQDLTVQSPALQENGLGGLTGSVTGSGSVSGGAGTGDLVQTVGDTANSLLNGGQAGGGLLGGSGSGH
jgi:hypothetical protein